LSREKKREKRGNLCNVLLRVIMMKLADIFVEVELARYFECYRNWQIKVRGFPFLSSVKKYPKKYSLQSFSI